jgi:molecular chaperone GrpE
VSENENGSAESDPASENDNELENEGGIFEEVAELSELELLKEELELAKKEAVTARDDMLRAHAEAENVRKRAERDVTAAHKFGLDRFIGSLVPVKDSMDLGLSALEATSDVQAIREGMELTSKMLDDAFEKNGVVAIDPTGDAFDPELHQAMTMQPSSEAAPGTVLSCMQKGYVLNERLVRPAMVVVAKAIEEQ